LKIKPCPCPEYGPAITNLNGLIEFANKHEHRYTGPFFRFCPWCGLALPIEEHYPEERA